MIRSEMKSLREEIDRLDDQLVQLLARRFDLTGRIGQLKAVIGEPPIDPDRRAAQARLLGELARRHQMDDALLVELYRCISNEVVARHGRLADAHHLASGI